MRELRDERDIMGNGGGVGSPGYVGRVGEEEGVVRGKWSRGEEEGVAG